MKPTPSQVRAIEHGGRNLQLIACAGSGKTEVVARRVVHLLTPGRPDSLMPRNIVAFTFTDKAAAELKERIITRTRAAADALRAGVLSPSPAAKKCSGCDYLGMCAAGRAGKAAA